ncbi:MULTISPECIES: tryptophan--tRNA ligase [unclassified Crossiella]|uniref:tryptophan--tRNA ligase n=1 Tax=unclassified Crossiella TaxID=2620835 RepID=UPI00200008E6|nr:MULTISPECIES: tryptophan--tRNA ligase [unclassified Crossiella]MCK2237184.1 tryptophan--tRNA ligase [Crossiella sp. S99.2]MCK2250839.1 tryptophan--tRNA ligase [Crossiella sp. S99.1]
MTQFSGIQPTGLTHLGNYLGALRQWAAQHGPDDLFCVVDLHAMTIRHNPNVLRARAREQLAMLLAAGVNPDIACVFTQSDLIEEHGALTWVLECVVSYGELARMTQFKEKAKGQDGVRAGLFTYPVLMAADILLHGADEVPVGDDQRQHLELARTLAKRFNATYGEVLTVPRAVTPRVGARVADLAAPERKMSKSSGDQSGTVLVMDPPELVRRKIKRAVTDQFGEVRHDPERQPGVTNLLDILGACTDRDPRQLAGEIRGYAELKEQTAEAVVETLRPVREGTTALLADPAELDQIRAHGAERARARCRHRLDAVLKVTGLR